MFVPSWACEVNNSIELYEKTNWWIHVIFHWHFHLETKSTICSWFIRDLSYNVFDSLQVPSWLFKLDQLQHYEYIFPKSLAFMNMKLSFMTNDILHAILYLVNCQTNTKSILQSCSYYLWSMDATTILHQDGSWRIMNNDFVPHNSLFQSSI